MRTIKTTHWKLWTAILGVAGLGASSLQAQLTFSNGLKLWLKADAGVTTNASGLVSSWADQTTNGFNVSQATDSFKPLLADNQFNNLPVLRFDGVNDFLNNTVANIVTGAQARTVFLVGKQDPTDNTGTMFTFRRSTSGGMPIFAIQEAVVGANNILVSDGVARNNTTASQFATTTNRFVTTVSWAGGNLLNTVQDWLNGNSQAVSGPVLATETGLTGFTVGNREDITGANWKGDIAEILVYDHVLAANNRQDVYEYLGVKYAIPEPSIVVLLALGGLWLWRRGIR